MTEDRTRQTRQEEARTERRRRSDTTIDGGQGQNLPIPPEVAQRLAAEGRTPRWANDTGNRIHALTVMDDYDKVDGVEAVEVLIDREKNITVKAYLLSKPSEFITEDRNKRENARRDTESAMLKGRIPGDDNPLPSEVSYADNANKIERGRFT